MLFVTRWGIGLTPDSMMYIGTARGVLAGQGIAMRVEPERYSALVSYGPGYSLMLAGLSAAGLGAPIDAARAAGAILFAVNILLVAWLTRAASGSAWAALFAAALMLVSPHMVRVHAYALAEPLFICFVLVGLGMLGQHIQRGDRRRLVAAGAFLVLGYLTRYAGLAFIGAGIAVIFLWSGRSPTKRLRRAAFFAGIALLPVVLWMARNAMVGSAVGRPLAWHPISVKHLIGGWTTVTQWFLPEGVSSRFLREALIVGAGAAVVLYVSLMKPFGSVTVPPQPTEPAAPPSVTGPILAVAALLYVLFLVVSISLFDFDTPLSFRILAPVFVCAMIAVAGFGARIAPIHPTLKIGVMALPMTLLPLHAYGGAMEYRSLRREGAGYASPQWTHHPLLQAVRELPPHVRIYTNAPDVLFLLADRNSICLPSKRSLIAHRPNPDYAREVQEVSDALRSGNAVIVYFPSLTEKRPNLPLEKELRAQMSLRVVREVRGGRIYEWSASSTQSAR
jgi:4-amino-4-deoxy-L-arabinose transferase-like glycosyltransferase